MVDEFTGESHLRQDNQVEILRILAIEDTLGPCHIEPNALISSENEKSEEKHTRHLRAEGRTAKPQPSLCCTVVATAVTLPEKRGGRGMPHCLWEIESTSGA